MNIIGIDPGLSGALAVREDITEPVTFATLPWVEDTPVFVKAGTKGRHEYDIPAMRALLLKAANERQHVHVFIERQQAMPGQGVSSMFKIGYGYGIWLGLLGALCLPYTVVSPITWQKEMYLGASGEGKERSILVAQRLFPNMTVKKSQSGRADALLIMEYGSRLNR